MERDVICLDCQATVDSCWRWCPECGSLALVDPEDGTPIGRHDYSVDWVIEGGSGSRERPGGDSRLGSLLRTPL